MQNVPEKITKILTKLEDAGYEAFLVGGCVRDFIMGIEPHDFDVCTSATTDEMLSVFSDEKVIETGLKHGTITVLSGGEPVEVTTYRIDGDYSDHRHPDKVTFTRSLEEDLKRRDFTINAMAYSPQRGLIDLFGGQDDIKAGLIRAVGDPAQRFNEDSLRILRGLRFSARFSFEIEASTLSAMRLLCGNLKDVSAERIYKELIGLLSAEGEGLIKVLLTAKEVVFSFLPELRAEDGCPQVTRFHKYDVWTHTCVSTAAVKNDPILRLAMLLHDVAKPAVISYKEDGRTGFPNHDVLGAEIAGDILRRLKAPTKTRETVVKYIESHEFFKKADVNSYVIGKFIGKMGSLADAENMIEIFRADMAGKAEPAAQVNGPAIDKMAREIYNYKIEGKCFRTADLKLGGDDLISLGVKRGPAVGEMLERLLDLVLADGIKNEKEELCAFVKKMLAHQ